MLLEVGTEGRPSAQRQRPLHEQDMALTHRQLP